MKSDSDNEESGESNQNDEEGNHKAVKKEKKSCYKVITADKNDDIVDFQASLIVGVAREICAQE